MASKNHEGNLRDFHFPTEEKTNKSASLQKPLEQLDAVLEAWDRDEDPNAFWGTEPELARPQVLASQSKIVEKNQIPQEPLKATPKRELSHWAIDLAVDERRMEKMGMVDVAHPHKRLELLKRKTTEFLNDLQKEFRRAVELFNEARMSPDKQLHVYQIANSDADFMLFRNGVKLIISGAQAGKICFAFNQYFGQVFQGKSTEAPAFEIEASFGAFDQLYWSFKGEKVNMSDLVRYFLGECVRQSAR